MKGPMLLKTTNVNLMVDSERKSQVIAKVFLASCQSEISIHATVVETFQFVPNLRIHRPTELSPERCC